MVCKNMLKIICMEITKEDLMSNKQTSIIYKQAKISYIFSSVCQPIFVFIQKTEILCGYADRISYSSKIIIT